MPEPERRFRILPAVTPENEHFWTGGAYGELRMLRCRPCGTWIHPPAPICPRCLAKDREIAALSGRARVASFTVNHQPWIPGFPPPYVIAIVELPEQVGLRLTTNLVNCAPESVRVGMAVRVVFEPHDAVYLPLFEPDPSA